jgi:serine/threonine protein kinase/tetratricopeptide (TPR) repeat protein
MPAHPRPNSPPKPPTDGSDLVAPRGAEPESEIVGPVAGRYDLVERIAKGGMGIVYRAQDRLLNRTVAIKIIRSRFLERPDLLRRFLAEARINGRLQHPGIVPVYEVGTLPDARPFIAMKLIEGRTLTRLMRERKEPADNLPQFLKVFQALCQTVAYAHQQGVIHRDLKPDNVMVGEFGEVQVMDWGLAKFLDPAAILAPAPDGFEAVERSAYLSGDGTTPAGDGQTQVTAVLALGPDTPVGYTTAGEVIGTLPYMPPEQARGESDRVDRRGDVFSLGAILCQILTGQPPYFGPPEALRAQAREGKLFGAYILLDRCGADPALVALAKQCLVANPDGRPADAGVLAALVTECLDGLQNQTRAIEVKQATAETRLAEAEARERLVKRARRLSGMLAVAGVLVAGLFASGLGWYAKDRAARDTNESRRRAVALQRIEKAIAEAAALDDQARSAVISTVARDAAARQAVSACQRADDLIVATPNPPTGLTERLTALKVVVAETERGTRLTVALEEWRADLFDARGNLHPTSRGLWQILSDHGIEVLHRDGDAVAAEILAHPAAPGIRSAMTDQLALEDPDTERELRAILRRAWGEPPDAYILLHSDAGRDRPDKLVSLGLKAEVPASWLIVGAHWLTDEKLADAAEQLLAHGVRRFPADFTLNAMYGSLLRQKPGGRADAVRHLAVARAVRPGDATVQQELGLALADAGRTDEALDVLRSAVRVAPAWVEGHVRIGELLERRGDEAAIEAFEAAVHVRPKSADLRANLGESLWTFGRFREAAATLREAADRLPADSPRGQGLRSQARAATRFAVLSDRLPTVLAGTLTPATPEAWADYGDVARRTKRYAAAARCFAAAAEGDQRFAGPAAVCAALAGFGRGSDASGLSPEARAELRQTALASFRQSRGTLADPQLDSLKDPSELKALPASERAAWRSLWAGE